MCPDDTSPGGAEGLICHGPPTLFVYRHTIGLAQGDGGEEAKKACEDELAGTPLAASPSFIGMWIGCYS